MKKLNDPTWPLYKELSEFVDGLPATAVNAPFADNTFVSLYGNDERPARAWFAQWLLQERASSARLKKISEARPVGSMSCIHDLGGVAVDDEGLVKLAEFDDAGGTISKNGFSFTVCPTTCSPNSTFWLLRSFYEQGVAEHVRVRLDPFLWGRSTQFPHPMFKMIVYARPVNWDGIGQLEEQHHGRMISGGPPDRSELTEFCWDPRNDGIHFICESLPAKERISFEGARYLHAIYDPDSGRITHLDARSGFMMLTRSISVTRSISEMQGKRVCGETRRVSAELEDAMRSEFCLPVPIRRGVRRTEEEAPSEGRTPRPSRLMALAIHFHDPVPKLPAVLCWVDVPTYAFSSSAPGPRSRTSLRHNHHT